MPQTFNTELWRDNWFIDDYIGTATFNRNGYSSATWTNVGSANYFFYFTKASDGYRVTSDNVRMYN